MKVIMVLLKNPIVRIVGMCVILYFGLLSNKENKEGLGYRLSKENISHRIDEVKEHSTYIMTTINEVKNVEAGSLPAEALQEKVSRKMIIHDVVNITTEDEELGVGDLTVSCGDQAKISYVIFIKENNVELDSVKEQILAVGSKKNKLLEDKIIGMKEGGVRIINIPKNTISPDAKLNTLLKFNETDLYYKIKLVKFIKSLESIKCN